jgi:hypothetical protein
MGEEISTLFNKRFAIEMELSELREREGCSESGSMVLKVLKFP